MKEFQKPTIEVIEFEQTDVLTDSDIKPCVPISQGGNHACQAYGDLCTGHDTQ